MTTPTDRFAFPKPVDADAADLPTQLGNIVEKVEDRLTYAGAQAGKSIQTASQDLTSTSYAALGNPDRVAGLVVPTDGLLFLMFRSLWKLTGATNAGNAALFLNGTQLQHIETGAVFQDDAAGLGQNGTGWGVLCTGGGNQVGFPVAGAGLYAGANPGADSTLASTPETWGPASRLISGGLVPVPWQPIVIEAPAGTYTVEMRYKVAASGGGTLSVKERKLWVWSKEFPATGV